MKLLEFMRKYWTILAFLFGGLFFLFTQYDQISANAAEIELIKRNQTINKDVLNTLVQNQAVMMSQMEDLRKVNLEMQQDIKDLMKQ